jgi:hypothetical protein
VLVDTNSHQRNALGVELRLAEGVIENVGAEGGLFSVITFGAQPPVLVKSSVHADEAIAAIRGISIGADTPSSDSPSVGLYTALNIAFDEFGNHSRSRTLLVVTEGNDSPRGRAFQQTLSRAQRLRVACNVAMVADNAFYGSKAIQTYGFYLRKLAGKTHGRYLEVGGRQEKVSRSVEQLSRSVLEQDASDRR